MKIYISIQDAYISSSITNIQKFPVDYVIRFNLNSYQFKELFFDFSRTQDERFRNFFSENHPSNNYITLASRLCSIILNTHDDININPIILKQSINTNTNDTNDIEIYNYFFNSIVQENITVADYIENTLRDIKLAYESQNNLNNLFESYLQVGDSIYIEGSLNLPTNQENVIFRDISNNVYTPLYNGV